MEEATAFIGQISYFFISFNSSDKKITSFERVSDYFKITTHQQMLLRHARHLACFLHGAF